MEKCIYVGMGGFIGSIGRYLLTLAFSFWTFDFPLATLLINFGGAVLIGIITEFAVGSSVNPNLVLFLKTGICGGFTTFSTFSLETATLLENGKTSTGISYAVLSAVLCVLGIFLGKFLVRLFVPLQHIR